MYGRVKILLTTVISAILLVNLWKKLFSLLSVSPTVSPSDPNVDYVMVFRTGDDSAKVCPGCEACLCWCALTRP